MVSNTPQRPQLWIVCSRGFPGDSFPPSFLPSFICFIQYSIPPSQDNGYRKVCRHSGRVAIVRLLDHRRRSRLARTRAASTSKSSEDEKDVTLDTCLPIGPACLKKTRRLPPSPTESRDTSRAVSRSSFPSFFVPASQADPYDGSAGKLALVFIGMLLSVFLIALDQVSFYNQRIEKAHSCTPKLTASNPDDSRSALPVIASKFNALDEIAWIASAYFLTQDCHAVALRSGAHRVRSKVDLLVAIGLFEIPSPTRSAGDGACKSRAEGSLDFTGEEMLNTLRHSYINLPFGAVTIAAIMLILGPQPAPPATEAVVAYTTRKWKRWTFGKIVPAPESFFFRLLALDWWGSVLLLGTITSLLLPLQWGSAGTYAWSAPIMIASFAASPPWSSSSSSTNGSFAARPTFSPSTSSATELKLGLASSPSSSCSASCWARTTCPSGTKLRSSPTRRNPASQSFHSCSPSSSPQVWVVVSSPLWGEFPFPFPDRWTVY
ncbi:hypothetical protein U1Q18_052283 [Sarracenia purpurea var. burkii]